MHEVMGWPGPMTDRQYEVWMVWLSKEYNQPSRSDYYLMRIALEIRTIINGLSNRKDSLDLEQFKLNFNQGKKEQGGLTKEQVEKYRIKMEQAAWFAKVGYIPNERDRDRKTGS